MMPSDELSYALRSLSDKFLARSASGEESSSDRMGEEIEEEVRVLASFDEVIALASSPEIVPQGDSWTENLVPRRRQSDGKKLKEILSSEQGKKTLTRLRRSTVTQPVIHEALEAAVKEVERADRHEDEDETTGNGEDSNSHASSATSSTSVEEADDDGEVSDMRDVLMAPVPMEKRRRLRDRLAAAGIARGRPNVVRRQLVGARKGTRRRSRPTRFFRRLLGLDRVERRHGATAASVFSFIIWAVVLNLVCLLPVLFMVLWPQLAENGKEGAYNEAEDGECTILINGEKVNNRD